MKDEQEEGVVVDVVVEKQVHALNKSLIKIFKQGITPSHGIGSCNARIALVCQICTPSDHVVTICPRIGYLKSKFHKCDFPHNIKNCDLKHDYYTNMGHIKE